MTAPRRQLATRQAGWAVALARWLARRGVRPNAVSVAGIGFAATAGVAGGLIMSAIKRDRGVKDYGAFIEGHGGMLDRIDSLCFAAPVFFHLTRFFYAM
jgi:predicted CDP-diglyceride synthetase/phosphatidate cytidylyltransferase